MPIRRGPFAAQWLVVCGLALSGCASNAAPPPPAQSDLKPYVSIKELMENIIDPIADNIFDAVSTDISAKGVVDIKPTTDEDWAKVRIGAVTLQPKGRTFSRSCSPSRRPETTTTAAARMRRRLSPQAIQSKIDGDRALWNKHADELRDEALKVLDLVKAKNADEIFQAGSRIVQAVCEKLPPRC